MKTGCSLRELFSFPGFVAGATLRGVFGDPKARIVTLRRRKKRRCVRAVASVAAAATTSVFAVPATCGWRPFRTSVNKNAANAAILFDKFHIMRHLSDALDQVRRDDYKRLQGKDRSYIKG